MFYNIVFIYTHLVQVSGTFDVLEGVLGKVKVVLVSEKIVSQKAKKFLKKQNQFLRKQNFFLRNQNFFQKSKNFFACREKKTRVEFFFHFFEKKFCPDQNFFSKK